MHLDLLLLSFSVQTICMKYLYCSEVKNPKNPLSIIHLDLTLMRALPLEFTRRQAGPKLISLIKEASKPQPSTLGGKKKIKGYQVFFN